MTWSIVARDPATGHLGVAVASRFFAVGGIVPHVRGGVGAVATQAFVNPLYGVDGLAALAAGKEPKAVVAELTARDEGRDQRQMHLIDAQGRNAAFTGEKCIDWAGHLVEEDISVAGFDGIPFGSLVRPPLTTIVQPSFEKGKTAAELVIRKLRGENPADILLPFYLKIGPSTGSPKIL